MKVSSSFYVFILVILAVFVSDNALKSQETKVLFIGNSYTHYNNLPQLFQDVALSAGDTVLQDKSTIGGASLSVHTSNANTWAKIRSDDWDYVVLQGHSRETTFPIEQVEAQTFPFAALLCDSIRANQSCAQVLFYRTWGRENGDASNCRNWPPVCTYEGMDSLLNLRYKIMAEKNKAMLAPVGAVWKYLRKNHPEIDLYDRDGSHPSLAGSYAAACTFYAAILKKDPTLITYNAKVDRKTATAIKRAAGNIVFKNQAEWNIGIGSPQASFEFSQQNEMLSFSNTSINADSIYWDFGDGTFSNELNPTHRYESSTATYSVGLTVFLCDQVATHTQEVSIMVATSKNTSQSDPLKWNVYANPADNVFYFEKEGGKLKIKESLGTVYNEEGEALLEFNPLDSLNLSRFENGVYYLELKDIERNRSEIHKVVVVH